MTHSTSRSERSRQTRQRLLKAGDGSAHGPLGSGGKGAACVSRVPLRPPQPERPTMNAPSRLLVIGCLALPLAAARGGDAPPAARDAPYFPTEVTQTEADEYTRYELLAPESASFKIRYEVTATTAGARVFYNPIRKGSVASDEHVIDAASGAPLKFEVVSGEAA